MNHPHKKNDENNNNNDNHIYLISKKIIQKLKDYYLYKHFYEFIKSNIPPLLKLNNYKHTYIINLVKTKICRKIKVMKLLVAIKCN